MPNRKSPPSLWAGQLLHLCCLTLLLVLTWIIWTNVGKPSPGPFWIAIAVPIAHQIFVWLAWRLELNSSLISNTIGFRWYVILFFILFGGRFVSLLVLAWVDQGSLQLALLPQVIVTIILVLPGIYAMYSVQRYFGMVRASGADHFDSRYREMPFVRAGIFRFTNNGMYVYAFLLFWALAVGFNSAAALIVAVFSHAYIWVHFYATEKPDMDYLYGPD